MPVDCLKHLYQNRGNQEKFEQTVYEDEDVCSDINFVLAKKKKKKKKEANSASLTICHNKLISDLPSKKTIKTCRKNYNVLIANIKIQSRPLLFCSYCFFFGYISIQKFI